MNDVISHPPPPPALDRGRRRRARDRKTADIERAALELFARHGFGQVTIDQIAEASGISRRTFFRYFKSKENVLLGEQHRFERALAETLEEGSGPVLAALRRRLIALAAETAADSELIRLRLQLFEQSRQTMAAASEQLRTYRMTLVPLLGARLGLDPVSDMRPHLIVSALINSTTIALWHWLATGASTPVEIAVGDAIDHALAGYRYLDES
ncbi:MAG: TetR family transcriptional regulator [Caulobacteraceae bacterium]|nr:TetR family transcriptional regulator [Caulobacteraceae bacterium]